MISKKDEDSLVYNDYPLPWEAKEKYSKNSFQVGPAFLGDLTNPENKKWAQLISASPDLLIALKEVLEWVEVWNFDFKGCPEGKLIEKKAKAAIAKAEGKVE